MDQFCKLLIVDDSRLSRMVISKIVSTHYPNWQIMEAENADQALSLCQEHRFDFITLDNNMPGMSGMEAYPLLRASQPECRIGLFTANIQKSVQEKTDLMGLDFIPKPLDEEKVMSFIKGIA